MTSERIDPKIWKVVVVVFLAPFMTQMDSTVVNVSLSTIRDNLHATIASAQWIISAYLLALALVLPLNGWLVDRFGAKRLYLVCFSSFTAASLLCGASHTMNQLIGARVLQGIAGGLLAPMTMMMIARVAGKQITKIIGYAAMPILVAPIIGPILAGAILKYGAWPWLFYINLPIGIIAVILAAILLPSDERVIRKHPFDHWGFLLISPALACLLFGLEETAHHRGVLILLIGIVLGGAFFWHARRKQAAALIDLSLFKNPIFLAATRTQFFSNGVMYAGQFLIPLYITAGLGFSPAKAGWLLMPMGIGMLVTFPLVGYLTDRFGCRKVVLAGITMTLLGTIPFLWMLGNSFSTPLFVICMILRGAGQGATGAPSSSAAYTSVPKSRLPVATTAINIVQRLGGPVATTLMAIVMSYSVSSFTVPFIALIVLQILTFGSANPLPKQLLQPLEVDELAEA